MQITILFLFVFQKEKIDNMMQYDSITKINYSINKSMPHICSRCRSPDVIVYLAYPRAADEPIIVYIYCKHCGYDINFNN